MNGLLLMILVAIAYLVPLAYYWHMAWFRPKHLTEYGQGVVASYPRWWPMRSQLMEYAGSQWNVWVTRIVTTLAIIMIVVICVVIAVIAGAE